MSEKSDWDAGAVGETRSDAPMDEAMEMATAATPTATETARTIRFKPMGTNENGKRRRRTQFSAPSDWRSRIERRMQQQEQELTQLHQTIGHLTNLVEAQAAHDEAQWLAMMAWMQESEQKWDARHEDD